MTDHGGPPGGWAVTMTGAANGVTHTTGAILGIVATPDFTLGVSPASQSVIPPANASYTISVTNPVYGFNSAVNFALSGLPAGATYSFNPSSVTGAGSTTLTINVPSGAQTGLFTPSVTATSGSVSHQVTPVLAVQAPSGTVPATLVPPSPPELTNLTGATTFGWSSGTGVSQYSLVLESIQGAADCSPRHLGGDLSTVLTPNASCCPVTGNRPLFATLASYTGNAWSSQSYSYTCTAPGPAGGVSVSPAIGTGSSQTFTATYSDTNGASSITQAWFQVQPNGGSSPVNQCITRYDAGPNNLYLLADDGSTLLGPITGGGYDTLSNSQCAVTGGYNVQVSGTTLSVDFSAILTTGFAGTKRLFLSALDAAAGQSPLAYVGTWNVPGASGAGTGVTGGPPPDSALPTPPATLPPPFTGPPAQNCSDITGTWTDPNLKDNPTGSSFTWSLQQNGNNISGTLSDQACNVQWNNVKGSVSSTDNSVHLEVTPPQGSVTCHSKPWEVPTFISVDIQPTRTNPVPVMCSTATPTNETVANAQQPHFVDYLLQAPPSSWTRISNSPGIILTFNLGAGNAVITLTAAGKSGTISITLNQGSSSAYTLKETANATSGNSFYTISFDRTQIPAQAYTSATATLDDLSVTVPVSFTALGNYRFSQYNTPTEQYCAGGATPVYVFENNQTCTYYYVAASQAGRESARW